MKFKKIAISLTIIIAIIGGVFANEDLFTHLQATFGDGGSPPPTTVAAQGTIDVAFSPNNGVTELVVKNIGLAQKTILVSAYSFTSKDIAEALLAAKKRGVDIKIILDKSQISQKYSSATFFTNQGFDLRIDIKHAIFHDKVMIIDDKTVITGSFNFTKAAETKNAENLLVLHDNPELAKLYTQDWWYNWKIALSRDEFMTRKASKAKVATEND